MTEQSEKGLSLAFRPTIGRSMDNDDYDNDDIQDRTEHLVIDGIMIVSFWYIF